MGIESSALYLLLGARARGVDFSDLAMLGRQAFFPHASALNTALRRLSSRKTSAEFAQECAGYSEPLFKLLGAETINSFDAAPYEGATHVHDFNNPIGEELKNRFSVVFDGGTLEHVFNFPQGIKNCMEMVRPGGHFLQVTVANNWMGHGFYQFSPEMMFRLFSQVNGFCLDAVLLTESRPNGKWWKARDPQTVGWRIEVLKSRPLYIMTLARRTELVPVLRTFPQQSDYVSTWNTAGQVPQSPTFLQSIRRHMPESVKTVARSLIRTAKGGSFHREFFQRLSLNDVVEGRFD